MSDAALSAFSVFFTQSPSFLDFQARMKKKHSKSNAETIFGVHQLPSTSQICNLLDPIEPKAVYPLLADIGEKLMASGHLDGYRSLSDTWLVALDGTDTFSSAAIHCESCCRQAVDNGKVRHRHVAVTPVLVAPGKGAVVPLPPEFVRRQDGGDKQDCEILAAKRWLETWGPRYAPRRVTLLGDDLYCRQPFCEAVLAQGMAFLLTCKPESHPLLYEWIGDFERLGLVRTVTRIKRHGAVRHTERYRFANQVPLRDSDDALLVDWCEVVITNDRQETVYRNAWATSHAVTDDTVAAVVQAGRSRWKIENENNNVLKNHGYHFEHNFAHGKKHLSNLLATFNLLAFLVHTALDFLDLAYQAARQAAPSRRTFFEQMRTLLHFVLFKDWDEFLLFMQDG